MFGSYQPANFPYLRRYRPNCSGHNRGRPTSRNWESTATPPKIQERPDIEGDVSIELSGPLYHYIEYRPV